MKMTKRIISFLIVALLVAAALPVSSFAAQANTPKEEVVYVNLNADGSVKEIYVVNIFELDADGKVIDYGEYESLRNMTATDEIGYSGNKITVDAKAGKLYYEGNPTLEVEYDMEYDLEDEKLNCPRELFRPNTDKDFLYVQGLNLYLHEKGDKDYLQRVKWLNKPYFPLSACTTRMEASIQR